MDEKMNYRWIILSTFSLLLFIGFTFAPPIFGQEEELTAREILDRVDDLYRGESSTGTMTMEIVTEYWSRTLTLEFWAKGKDKSLIRILSPKKEKGTGTLRVDKDIWNYLPKVNRTIKVPSSMMSQSWMGSHFTNDDLVRESRMADDYDFEITFQGERDGFDVVEITCIPKPEAAIVWGKVVVIVMDEEYIPISMLYYDEDMDLARTMTFSDIREIDGREIPTTMIVVPSDKPEESTFVRYDEITFDVDVGENTFTLRNLQK
jgi:outer membrane lipoprotein-sorting protein